MKLRFDHDESYDKAEMWLSISVGQGCGGCLEVRGVAGIAHTSARESKARCLSDSTYIHGKDFAGIVHTSS